LADDCGDRADGAQNAEYPQDFEGSHRAPRSFVSAITGQVQANSRYARACPPTAGTDLAPCDLEIFLITNITRLALATIVAVVCAGCGSTDPLSPTASTTGTPSDFQGQYSGTYRVNDCLADGIFVGFCEASGLVTGATPPISLSVTQNQSAVSGTVLLGSIAGTFVGTVSGSTLTGSAVMTDITEQDVTVSATIPTWNTTLSSSGLSGGFTVVFRVAGQTGSATMTTTIVQLTH
jgi:hypothetical protein